MSMHPPPDPDELASDLVDGLLPADQVARLRSDPAIAARVEAIEAARAALQVPPPSASGAVDRALAATFAALDRGTLPGSAGTGTGTGSGGDSGQRPPPPVTHLRSVGPRGGGSPPPVPPASTRRPRRSNGTPWLAAAAALVLLGLVTVGILSNKANSGNDTSAASDMSAATPDAEVDAQTEAGDAGGQSGDASAGPLGSGSGTDGAPTATTSTAPSTRSNDLGAVSAADELADPIRAQHQPLGPASGDSSQAEGSFGESSPPDEGDCAGLTAAGDASRGRAVYVADAVLAGDPVRVHLYDPGDGNLRLVATDASCADVVDMPYTS